jgi:hypothetical protein
MVYCGFTVLNSLGIAAIQQNIYSSDSEWRFQGVKVGIRAETLVGEFQP